MDPIERDSCPEITRIPTIPPKRAKMETRTQRWDNSAFIVFEPFIQTTSGQVRECDREIERIYFSA